MSPTAAPRRQARRTRLSGAVVAGPLALGVLLTGCSSGQLAQTTDKRPSVEGAQVQTGDLKVLNIHFAAPDDEGKYAAGDTVELEFAIASGGAEDEITGITVDGADATITADGATNTDSDATTIEIPAGGITVVGDDGDFTVEATMTEEIYPATLIPVVITFKEAGELEIEVPIAASLDEIDRDPDEVYTPGNGEGGGH